MQIRGRLIYLESLAIHLFLAHSSWPIWKPTQNLTRDYMTDIGWEFSCLGILLSIKRKRGSTQRQIFYFAISQPLIFRISLPMTFKKLRSIATGFLEGIFHKKNLIISKNFILLLLTNKDLTPAQQPERLCFLKIISSQFLKVLKPTIFIRKTTHPPTP